MGMKPAWKYFLVGLVVLSTFFVGMSFGGSSDQALLEELGQAREDIAVTKNKNVSLTQALRVSAEEQAVLLDSIATLKARPKDIEYIVRTNVVTVEKEKLVVLNDLPASYFHTWDNGLVVASFESGEDYTFKTYPIGIESTIVITDDKTSVLVEATSTYDNKKVTLDSEVVTKALPKHKKFEPHFGVGLTGATWDIRANAFVSFYHPTPNLDVGSVRVSGNSDTLAIGLDPIAYNIGSRVPVITDLWISPGVDYTTNQEVQFSLNLGSKF